MIRLFFVPHDFSSPRRSGSFSTGIGILEKARPLPSEFARADLSESVLYVATKSAVDAITRSLAKELGPRKIRVNAISPGVVETEGTHTGGIIGSDFEREAVRQTPLGRFGQPADIAPVAVFLASDARVRCRRYLA